jgi:hypothetical protein
LFQFKQSLNPEGQKMKSILPRTKSVSGCPVCGSQEVMHDEVAESSTLQLAECRHCDHRWTARGSRELLLSPVPRSLMQVRPLQFGVVLDEEGEVASAA